MLKTSFGVAAVAATLAFAAPATAGPDPLDPKAPVPALHYTSTLKRHAPATADKPVPWREANETVTRIGGWRAYAREAQASQPAASQPGPHSGHKKP